jgi:membrane-bound PQQ-dependent dehydrogenase (glucose/quinate/shikimate family)
MKRTSLWGVVAALAVIAAIAVWQGLPLHQLAESRYYFLTAILFFAAAGWTASRGQKDAGEGLITGAAAGFAAFLTAVGSYLAVKGGQLAAMGGSPYYVIIGVAMIAVAVLLMLRSVWSARLYAAIVAVTVVWGVIESGFDLWGLMARLAAFLVVGLWFFAPWTKALFKTPAPKFGHARWNLAATAVGVVVLIAAGFNQSPVKAGSDFGAPKTNGVTSWVSYGGPTLSTRFAELTQINTDNVKGLKEIWRYRTHVNYDFKDTPQEVDGLVYVCTAGNTVTALDADTGQEKWSRKTGAKVPGGSGASGLEGASTYARTCRGLGYYDATVAHATPAAPTSAVTVAPGQVGPQVIATAPVRAAGLPADCPTRIITNTTNARLIALDAKTGVPCASFGNNGEVDLQQGMGFSPPGNYMPTSAPLVAGDLIVVGGWVTDNQQIGNPSGVVRAFSARTGQFVWAWDLGNPDNHGMPAAGGEFTRATPNVWTNMSYDPALNMVYVSTGNSSPDYFAGDLRTSQADKYNSSIVAIDAATGADRWHFQTVHRDIWDYDAPSQPVLVNVRRGGQVIPAVAQPTKRGEIFLLDRRTGVPVAPITETAMPQKPDAGELRLSATQPVSSLPNFRKDRNENDMWGLTPLDQLYCRVEFKKLRYEGHFTPPMRGVTPSLRSPADYTPSYAEARFVGGEQSGGSFQYPGNAGGFNWGSVSVDADNGLLIAAPMLMGNRITLSNAADRKAQSEAQKARQEIWWKAHPADKAAYDKAAAKAAALRAAMAPPRPAMAAAGARPAASGGFNPEGGPAGASNAAFDQKKVTYLAATSPFMSNFHVPFLGETQMPCFKPPFGVIAAMDLNTGKMMWTRPLGSMKESGPFGWKSGLPWTVGTPIQSGSISTRGGLSFHAGAMDSTVRAYDLREGKVLWSSALPGSSHAVPMSYLSPKGRQFVVVTVPNPSWAYPRPASGDPKPIDDQGGWVIAYALDK